MKKANALSRQPDHKRGVENNNSNITLLKPKYFCICAMHQGHLLIDGSEKETLSKIRKCTDLDKEVIKALKNMKGEKKKSTRGHRIARCHMTLYGECIGLGILGVPLTVTRMAVTECFMEG